MLHLFAPTLDLHVPRDVLLAMGIGVNVVGTQLRRRDWMRMICAVIRIAWIIRVFVHVRTRNLAKNSVVS